MPRTFVRSWPQLGLESRLAMRLHLTRVGRMGLRRASSSTLARESTSTERTAEKIFLETVGAPKEEDMVEDSGDPRLRQYPIELSREDKKGQI